MGCSSGESSFLFAHDPLAKARTSTRHMAPLRHWGATEMVEAKVPIKAAQERLGHSRPDVLLKV